MHIDEYGNVRLVVHGLNQQPDRTIIVRLNTVDFGTVVIEKDAGSLQPRIEMTYEQAAELIQAILYVTDPDNRSA